MKKTEKRRSDCFFGMHSDFHASPKDGLVIGATLKEEDIRDICKTLKPDFLQIDCKGHPGYTSYPSKLGNAMPNFALDPLKTWRKVTKEYGIPLYMHFSGVQEVKYCADHPEESSLGADGKLSNFVRLDSNYLDDYFIPQICELVDNYDIDGIWVDGDCWSVRNDFHPDTIAKFEKATGISLNGELPAKPGDKYFKEYSDFTREMFRNYLRHYVDVLHAKYPKLEICSNWAFSDQMPEPVCAKVDFLSGDLNPSNCINSARYAGRLLASHGMTWDLMAWGFRFWTYNVPLKTYKHQVQLMQEAGSVISLGGGFQNYVMQFEDGSPDVVNLKKNKPLADFMHARKKFCHGGKIVKEAVMLVPNYDRYHELERPFTRTGCEKLMGLTGLLCDSGMSLEINNEQSLRGKYNDYKLVIVPELYKGLLKETIEELRDYVKSGGSLLIVGTKTAQIFADAGFGFTVERYQEPLTTANYANLNNGHDVNSVDSRTPYHFSVGGDDFGVTICPLKIYATMPDALTLAKSHTSLRDNGEPLAIITKYQKGKVGVIATNLGTQYSSGMQYLHRTLIRKTSANLYDPLARVEDADNLAEITCLNVNGDLTIQILNTNGEHTNPNISTITHIPPVENLTSSVKEIAPIKKVIIEPEGLTLKVKHIDGRAHFTVPRIDIHSVARIIFKKQKEL